MLLKKLHILNFRNLKNEIIYFNNGTNIFLGQNAQGKTNILEAIWCFTGAKSFRGSKDNELICFGEQKASLKLEFFEEDRNQECVINIENKRSAVLNSVEYNSASMIAGKILSIVFSPNDLNIIKDGPVFRRKFMDTALCQLYPNYINISKRYLRALEQRNKILKDLKYNPIMEEFIDDFEKELAVLGSEIVNYRKNYINLINEFLPNIYNNLSDKKETISIEYETTANRDIEEYLKKLKLNRKEDILSNFTSIGPHRDDINIKINNFSVRNFGSQGQKRSAAVALKLSESEVISKITGKKPVILLDDVMSELDISRQNYILNHIKDRQVFITCCDVNDTKLLENGKIFEVINGKVKEN